MQTQAPYEYIQGPGGQQMVACYDNSGTRFLLDYMLFNSLMNSGGYGGVMGYYHQYPSRVTVWNNSYSSWHSFNGRSYGASSYRGYNRPAGSSYRSNGPATSKSVMPNSYRSTTRPAGSSQPSARPSTFRSGNSSSYKPSSGGSSYRPSSSGSTYRSSSPGRSSGSSYHSSSSSSSRRH